MDTVFHEGERALQSRTGAREHLAQVGARVIRDRMPQQHRDFFAQLPFLVAGSVDAQGQPWASVLAGPPGFVASPDERQLVLHAWPGPHDPLAANLREGAQLGLLGIEPHTRRRNRANGTVTQAMRGEGFALRIDQSFGNCPKYIQAREAVYTSGAAAPSPAVWRGGALDEEAKRLVRGADTFYLATAYGEPGAAPAHGVDVSHRGGRPGFVRVDGDGTLTVPDFVGNFFFNTLGNLLVNPRAGLLFIDFDNGDALHLAASARLVEDGAELASFEGAQRLLRFEVHAAVRVPCALPLRWGPAQLSPHLAPTGRWT